MLAKTDTYLMPNNSVSVKFWKMDIPKHILVLKSFWTYLPIKELPSSKFDLTENHSVLCRSHSVQQNWIAVLACTIIRICRETSNLSRAFFNHPNRFSAFCFFPADGSGTIMVRGCALDSGTLTTDTELIRMSHCGSFYFDEK